MADQHPIPVTGLGTADSSTTIGTVLTDYHPEIEKKGERVLSRWRIWIIVSLSFLETASPGVPKAWRK